jgi:hypothetical protein
MVEKLVNSTLAFILLLATTGVTCHYHYCDNTLVSFSFFHTPKSCCEPGKDCCSDKQELYLLKTEFLHSSEHTDLSASMVYLGLDTNETEIAKPDGMILQRFPDALPPPTTSLRLARLQQFLI